MIDYGRVLIGVAVLLLYVLGYIYYEKTILTWWWHVSAAAVITILSIPLGGNRWRWLTKTDGWLNHLCHVYVIGGICYFLLSGCNYLLPTSAPIHEEQALVIGKKHTTRKLGYRSGRRYRQSNRKVEYYYLDVRFDNGKEKRVPVSRSTYYRARENSHWAFGMQRGALGFDIIKTDEGNR